MGHGKGKSLYKLAVKLYFFYELRGQTLIFNKVVLTYRCLVLFEWLNYGFFVSSTFCHLNFWNKKNWDIWMNKCRRQGNSTSFLSATSNYLYILFVYIKQTIYIPWQLACVHQEKNESTTRAMACSWNKNTFGNFWSNLIHIHNLPTKHSNGQNIKKNQVNSISILLVCRSNETARQPYN